MKSLRIRAVFKSAGYGKKYELINDSVHENKRGDWVYLELERRTYNLNLKHNKKQASDELMRNLFIHD